jgi:hypothetical protein
MTEIFKYISSKHLTLLGPKVNPAVFIAQVLCLAMHVESKFKNTFNASYLVNLVCPFDIYCFAFSQLLCRHSLIHNEILPEAELLDVIGTKLLRVFLFAIQIHLY